MKNMNDIRLFNEIHTRVNFSDAQMYFADDEQELLDEGFTQQEIDDFVEFMESDNILAKILSNVITIDDNDAFICAFAFAPETIDFCKKLSTLGILTRKDLKTTFRLNGEILTEQNLTYMNLEQLLFANPAKVSDIACAVACYNSFKVSISVGSQHAMALRYFDPDNPNKYIEVSHGIHPVADWTDAFILLGAIPSIAQEVNSTFMAYAEDDYFDGIIETVFKYQLAFRAIIETFDRIEKN